MYIVYILFSFSSGRYYIGQTKNLEKRIFDHNRGKVKSTKAYLPWKVIYTEEFSTKSEAYQRELKIKSFKSGEAFKNILNKNSAWRGG